MNVENLITCLDQASDNLQSQLRDRNFSLSALNEIQADLGNIVALLGELDLGDLAKSLMDCKNKFNVKTDDENYYAVVISNTKKVISGTKEYLTEGSMIDFKNTNFFDTSKVDIETVKLEDYFSYLRHREVLQVIFLEGYFQIYFDRGIVTCFSETFISNQEGSFQIPSKDGNWQLTKLIGKEIASAEEKGNEVILKAEDGTEISVNTRLGPQGDTFHITIEGLPTLRF